MLAFLLLSLPQEQIFVSRFIHSTAHALWAQPPANNTTTYMFSYHTRGFFPSYIFLRNQSLRYDTVPQPSTSHFDFETPFRVTATPKKKCNLLLADPVSGYCWLWNSDVFRGDSPPLPSPSPSAPHYFICTFCLYGNEDRSVHCRLEMKDNHPIMTLWPENWGVQLHFQAAVNIHGEKPQSRTRWPLWLFFFLISFQNYHFCLLYCWHLAFTQQHFGFQWSSLSCPVGLLALYLASRNSMPAPCVILSLLPGILRKSSAHPGLEGELNFPPPFGEYFIWNVIYRGFVHVLELIFLTLGM